MCTINAKVLLIHLLKSSLQSVFVRPIWPVNHSGWPLQNLQEGMCVHVSVPVHVLFVNSNVVIRLKCLKRRPRRPRRPLLLPKTGRPMVLPKTGRPMVLPKTGRPLLVPKTGRRLLVPKTRQQKQLLRQQLLNPASPKAVSEPFYSRRRTSLKPLPIDPLDIDRGGEATFSRIGRGTKADQLFWIGLSMEMMQWGDSLPYRVAVCHCHPEKCKVCKKNFEANNNFPLRPNRPVTAIHHRVVDSGR